MCGRAGRRVLIGGPGSLAIYGNRMSALAVPRRRGRSAPGRFLCSSSGSVGARVLGWGTLAPGVAGGRSFLLCACSGCMTCEVGLVSLKNNSEQRGLNRVDHLEPALWSQNFVSEYMRGPRLWP